MRRAAGLLACVWLVLAGTVADAKLKPTNLNVTTLKVTTARDELARHDRKCSLREAIGAVDSPGLATDCGTAGRRANTIVLGPGRYRLRIPPGAGDDNSTGDLNVISGVRLTIIGAGTGATVIDASGLGDRVVSIASGTSVTLSRLTITGGHPSTATGGSTGNANVSCGAGGAGGNGNDASIAGSGGGVLNDGALNLEAVTVSANIAASGGAGGVGGTQDATSACGGGNGGQGASGGGIYNQGRLIVTASSIRANEAGTGGAGGPGGNPSGPGNPGGAGGGGQGGGGGGIDNQGTLSVTASTISQNRAGLGGQGGTGGVVPPAGDGGSGGAILSASGALDVSNSTFTGNFAGAGGAGGGPVGAGSGPAGNGGAGGNGGAIGVTAGASRLLNATVASNGIGPGGIAGSARAGAGAGGLGGGLFVRSVGAADDMKVENTIVASSIGSGCAGSTPSAIANGGGDLTYGDRSCPGANRNPKLGNLSDNGGATWTLALGPGSAAIDRVPRRGAHCPATDQRGVRRPQGRGCDIGAFEFAVPVVTIISPLRSGSYARGLRITAQFRCREGGINSPIAACRGTVRSGHTIDTRSAGAKSFRVTATDKTGHKVARVVHYTVWRYTNPLSAISGLFAGRIDMGVDYAGSGPILAVGRGRVTMASNNDFGPQSCWGITCWPGGGIVVYRLLDGPFAGKYVYAAENITVNVSAGQIVQPGGRIATLHPGFPDMEIGWGSGVGAETLAIARGHQCTCGDPGGWSAVEGLNFDHLLGVLGAPSGHVQASAPGQSMPPGWPTWRLSARAASAPRARAALSEGATPQRRPAA